MSKSHLEAVIWDLDGVIADTAEYHYQAWQEVLGKRGVEFSRVDFMPLFGRRHDAIIKFVLGNGLPKKELEMITEEKQQSYRRRMTGNVRSIPGAVELIKSLHEYGLKQAIASSAVPENIEIVTRELGIADCFQAIINGMEVEEGKPDPQIFRLAAKRLKEKPENCTVIEDAIAGVAAAKQAGMKCIAVTNSHPKNSLKAADLVVDSLEKVSIVGIQKLFN
jgi:beta-phosphoglucomutase family hydrolase